MKKRSYVAVLAITMMVGVAPASAAEKIVAKPVDADLSQPAVAADFWKDVPAHAVTLTAQPMVQPRPAETRTESLTVQAVHDGSWASFRLRWKDPERSEGNRLGEKSDAVALQFPILGDEDETMPLAFMGNKGAKVHLLHWRAMFQADKDRGARSIDDIYPNLSVDMYPFDFADMGKLAAFGEDYIKSFSPALAAGNPQTVAKARGVAELVAEGYGTSMEIPGGESVSDAKWSDGEWVVVISRPLEREGASELRTDRENNIAFAVWQGGEGEVGSRKSVIMSWTPLTLASEEE